jgi:ribosomal protein L11 methyltransferase
MAFGSGEHPTTQLCLRAIERYTRAGTAVIDVGTGSGILAVAAARLGAARVVATDTDPVAVAAARDNARANRVASRVSVRETDGLRRLRLRAHLIVANLTAGTLPPVLTGARRCLLPGGRFVASGFGPAVARPVARAMRAAGLRPVAVEGLGGWCAVHAVASRKQVRRVAGARRAGRDSWTTRAPRGSGKGRAAAGPELLRGAGMNVCGSACAAAEPASTCAGSA